MPTETSMETVTVSWRMTLPKGYKKRYGTAMMIQSDLLKVYVQTQTTTLDMTHNGIYVLNGIIPNLSENLGLGVRTIQIADYTAADATVRSNLNVDPSPVEVNDGREHHYALTINVKEGRLIVYQDGYVMMSNAQWRPPVDNNHEKDIVRGIWFGSPEPEESNYQDEWDTKHSLTGWWRRMQVWNRELSPEQIVDIARTSTRDPTTTNSEQQHEPFSANVDTGLNEPVDESIENSIIDQVDEVDDGVDEVDNDPIDMENDWLSE